MWSAPLNPKGEARKNMDKSHKAEETIKHLAGEGQGGPEF